MVELSCSRSCFPARRRVPDAFFRSETIPARMMRRSEAPPELLQSVACAGIRATRPSHIFGWFAPPGKKCARRGLRRCRRERAESSNARLLRGALSASRPLPPQVPGQGAENAAPGPGAFLQLAIGKPISVPLHSRFDFRP